MHLHRSGLGWVVQTPAKLNLFFEVLGKREDGYHEIETLVCPIDLYDTLFFKEDSSGQIRLGCAKGSGSWGPLDRGFAEVPDDAENLAVRAVALLRRRAGECRGAELRLVKRIPSAAGLGGGSSDAAAALMAANAGWHLDWSLARLRELGAELGSDVPLFFAGGSAVCRGRGERVAPAPRCDALHFVVVRPPAGLSTAAVYRACRVPEQPRPLGPLLDALERRDWAAAGRLMFNRLHSAAAELSPWISRLQGAFSRLDCLGHQMSGSGTCYFGLCRHARHARHVARWLQANGMGTAFAVRGSR